MERVVRSAVFVAACVAALVCGCEKKTTRVVGGAVDLGGWTAINYAHPDSQPYAKWVVSEDRRSVTQTVNAAPSVFVSDFELGTTTVRGTWLVSDHNDDDLIGFAFAYRDPGHFYLFDWKGQSQDDCDVGMSLKITEAPYDGPSEGNLPSGKPFAAGALWSTKGAEGQVRPVRHTETEGWAYDKPYTFTLDIEPGAFRIRVADGERQIYDERFEDATYSGGRFGFYNYSQGGVVYRGFEQKTTITETHRYVPWWLIILIVVACILLVVIVRVARRKRA